MDLQKYLEDRKTSINKKLDQLVPAEEDFPPRLHQAMRYCLFSGGKRLRPILALAAAEAVGKDSATILQEACALELIHTYTLIHDDLPAMDNDDYRRGLPATHKVYGEALAILAGDALLTEAFKLLSFGIKQDLHRAAQIVEIIEMVAEAAGSKGLIGGQVVDLESEGKIIAGSLLEYIHKNKTERLITLSVILGAKLAGATEDQLACITRYGRAIGLAFQITDDILDVTSSTEELGKKVGSDQKKSKATYPFIFGMEEAKKRQNILYQDAINALRSFDEKADPLRGIGQFIIERKM